MEGLRAGPLVRAVSSTGIAIWTEWNHPCEVILRAVAASENQAAAVVTVSTRTVMVGERYYALSVISGLQFATWYSYSLSLSDEPDTPVSPLGATFLQCFRTLDVSTADHALRLAYGSCRRLSSVEPDALSAFGRWLRDCQEEREALWPHLLLLIGDQIYADDPAVEQARSFEDFARMYVKAWADDAGVRQALAVLPTAMIFDDHEITNNWNIVPTWQAWALQQGFEQTLVDGLVAYWLYQGWGNAGLQNVAENDLLKLMQGAEQSGEDVLETLRARVRQAIYQEKALQWDYTLPTRPPIFVADLRADRSVVLDQERADDNVSRIMGQEQMARLRGWAYEHEGETLLLVSSVPALLPPAIGFAEYMMGLRPWRGVTFAPVRRLARLVATFQQTFARRMGFEHWPVFNATWRELVAFLRTRERDLFILSGDVHFSYALIARTSLFARKGRSALYQLVASPFRNELGLKEKRLISRSVLAETSYLWWIAYADASACARKSSKARARWPAPAKCCRAGNVLSTNAGYV